MKIPIHITVVSFNEIKLTSPFHCDLTWLNDSSTLTTDMQTLQTTSCCWWQPNSMTVRRPFIRVSATTAIIGGRTLRIRATKVCIFPAGGHVRGAGRRRAVRDRGSLVGRGDIHQYAIQWSGAELFVKTPHRNLEALERELNDDGCVAPLSTPGSFLDDMLSSASEMLVFVTILFNTVCTKFSSW